MSSSTALRHMRLACAALLFAGIAFPVFAQTWDPGARLAETVATETEGKLKLSFESRGRYETREGQSFGRDPDLSTGLYRTRLGLAYTPAPWLKLSGMVQDARAPWYGSGAPSTVRDQADLHEGYIELFPDRKTGFGATAGRMMLNYGDGRLIGTPQWGNLSRTYDQARIYYRIPKARIEFLLVSPVKIRIGEFNRPVLGDRAWGVYNAFPNIFKKTLLEAYVLRHDQNRPGGFTGGRRSDGTDRLGVTSYGARWNGPVTRAVTFNLEGVLQWGKVGPADHRASAFVSSLTRRWTLRGKRTLDVSGEYKYASGTRDPQLPARTSTFDQIYSANHDKFGHEDLFGWRNLHNARSLATLGLSKKFALNFMYNNFWLASARDSLYNGSGKSIVRSSSGAAGRHVGQEADIFFTYKYAHFTFGSGYGHFFQWDFVRKTTPGVSPVYAYIFHTYSF